MQHYDVIVIGTVQPISGQDAALAPGTARRHCGARIFLRHLSQLRLHPNKGHIIMVNRTGEIKESRRMGSSWKNILFRIGHVLRSGRKLEKALNQVPTMKIFQLHWIFQDSQFVIVLILSSLDFEHA